VTWVFGFVRGVLTKHLGTKLLALLLAFVIFLFVQQSLQGTETLPRILIQFELTEKLSEKYVLLTERLEVQRVEIEGLRPDVDSVMQRFNADNVIRFRVSEELVARGSLNILIDADFLNDQRILGKDIRVTKTATQPLLEIDELVRPTVVPTLSPEMRQRLTIAPSTRLQPKSGSTLDAGFHPGELTMVGPSSAFPQGVQRVELFVDLPDLDALLNDPLRPSGQVSIPVAIDLSTSLIRSDRLRLVRVLKPEPMTWAEFVDRLRLEFEVEERRVTRKVPGLKVVRIFSPEEGRPSPEQYEPGAQPITGMINADYASGVCNDVQLKMPAALFEDKAFLAQLRLVVDFAAATVKGDSLEVPVYLDVADHTGIWAERLRQVQLVSDHYYMTFDKK